MIVESIKKMELGRYKAWFQRIASYLGPINFGLLLYLFVKENEWFPWYLWIIIFVSLIVSLLGFDIFFVLEGEQRYLTKKNPVLRKMRNQLDAICDHLGLEVDE